MPDAPALSWPLLAALVVLVPLLLIAFGRLRAAIDWLQEVRFLRGVRLRAATAEEVPEADVQPEARRLFRLIEPELAELGFAPGPWFKVAGPWLGREDWQRAYHGDAGIWAWVSAAGNPTEFWPCAVDFWSLRADGAALRTIYGRGGRSLGKMPGTTRVTGYPDTLAAQLALHQAALPGFLAGQEARTLTPAEQVAFARGLQQPYLDGLVADGLAAAGDDGLRMTWRAVRGLMRDGAAENRRWLAHQARLAREADSGSRAPAIADEVVAYHAAPPAGPVAGSDAATRWGLALVALVVLGLMPGLFGMRPDPVTVGSLFGALLLHEGGLLLAMKAAGYASPRIVFSPAFGPRAMGEPPAGLSSGRLAAVWLAGPLPGLILGAAALAWHLTTGEVQAWRAGFVLVALNLIAMLPFDRSTGGRLVGLLAPPLANALVAAVAGLLLAAAWRWHDRTTLLLAFGALAAVQAARLQGQVQLQALAADLPAPAAGVDRVAAAFDLLRDTELTPEQKRLAARLLVDAPPPLPPGPSLVLLAVMAITMVGPLWLAFAAWHTR